MEDETRRSPLVHDELLARVSPLPSAGAGNPETTQPEREESGETSPSPSSHRNHRRRCKCGGGGGGFSDSGSEGRRRGMGVMRLWCRCGHRMALVALLALCLVLEAFLPAVQAYISEDLVVETTKGKIRGVTLKSATNK